MSRLEKELAVLRSTLSCMSDKQSSSLKNNQIEEEVTLNEKEHLNELKNISSKLHKISVELNDDSKCYEETDIVKLLEQKNENEKIEAELIDTFYNDTLIKSFKSPQKNSLRTPTKKLNRSFNKTKESGHKKQPKQSVNKGIHKDTSVALAKFKEGFSDLVAVNSFEKNITTDSNTLLSSKHINKVKEKEISKATSKIVGKVLNVKRESRTKRIQCSLSEKKANTTNIRLKSPKRI